MLAQLCIIVDMHTSIYMSQSNRERIIVTVKFVQEAVPTPTIVREQYMQKAFEDIKEYKKAVQSFVS